MCALTAFSILLAFLAPQPSRAASISGKVTDAEGNPIEGVRVDHIGKTVVVARADLKVAPMPEEVRTNAVGDFNATTGSPAIVFRKAGYVSQRVLIVGDARMNISLQPIKSRSRCTQSLPIKVKTKEQNDIDYAATLYYIEAKDESPGILSGRGPMYSWGAPNDSYVWKSKEYAEVMYENGVIDARGESQDGKYWRSRTIFGAAARYDGVDRETADLLDCVMDQKKLP